MRLLLSKQSMDVIDSVQSISFSDVEAKRLLESVGCPTFELFVDVLRSLFAVEVRGPYFRIRFLPLLDWERPFQGSVRDSVEEPSLYCGNWSLSIADDADATNPHWVEPGGIVAFGDESPLSIDCSAYVEHMIAMAMIPPSWNAFWVAFKHVPEDRSFLEPLLEGFRVAPNASDRFGGIWFRENIIVSWRRNLSAVHPADAVMVFCEPDVPDELIKRTFRELPDVRFDKYKRPTGHYTNNSGQPLIPYD